MKIEKLLILKREEITETILDRIKDLQDLDNSNDALAFVREGYYLETLEKTIKDTETNESVKVEIGKLIDKIKSLDCIGVIIEYG
jgi:acetyl-CoA carboxylase beta subunit